MRYLIDTHIFIWWSYTPDKLAKKVFELLIVPTNEVFLSYASIWEMQIKIKKLEFSQPLDTLIAQQTLQNRIMLLPIETKHIFHLGQMPLYKDHGDPFDRMLIAQAAVEKMILISADHKIQQFNYGITILWE